MTNDQNPSEFLTIYGIGEPTVVELETGAAVLRVGIGEPGIEESGIWRIWSGPNRNDVYIANRTTAGICKVSLHESGRWMYQWTSQFWETGNVHKYAPTVSSRVIHEWPRSPEIGSGWTRALTIWTPSDGVLPPADQSSVGKKEVLWIPKPPSGIAVGIHVMLSEPDKGVFETKGFIPLAGWALPRGGSVHILASKKAVPPDVQELIHRDKTRALATADHERLREANEPRLMIFDVDETGVARLVDVAISDAEIVQFAESSA